MDNHPIPQDVTGFQFKLVGNMTVKQFAYVATGCVLAILLYYAPVMILIKLIFIPLLAGLGAALAFLPIEGRPMDLMLSNFLHDLFVPTQYLYHKNGGLLPISTIQLQHTASSSSSGQSPHHEEKHKVKEQQQKRAEALSAVLRQMSSTTKTALDEKEALLMQAVFDPNAQTRILTQQEEAPAVKEHTLSEEEAMRVKLMQSPEDMEHRLEEEAEAIKRELEQARQEEQQLEIAHKDTQAEEAHTHVTGLEQQLNDIMQQKAQLEQELIKLKEQLHQTQSAPQPAAPVKQEALKSSENVRVVPTDQARNVGLPALPDVPNMILGIIRDPRGNVLSNILVEIKDMKGDPVRAFKTNGLGQFASATPLPNGFYTVEFEDPKEQNRFDAVRIEAKGEIMLPLEVISRDAREDLRRELFA